MITNYVCLRIYSGDLSRMETIDDNAPKPTRVGGFELELSSMVGSGGCTRDCAGLAQIGN